MKVTVAGIITDPSFHLSCAIAKAIHNSHAVEIECCQFFETQWHQYLKQLANKLGGAFYDHSPNHTLVFINGCEYVGDADRFSQWALYNYQYQDQCLSTVYE